jgi:EmrB/QacA subfamily drug resistance transporter
MRSYVRSSPSSDHSHDQIVLVLACAAQFMVVLDVSVVNVALPSIGRALGYSPVGLQWVVNAYVLTFAGFLLLGGRAADLYGRRKVYLFGIGLFSATSLAGGLAQTSTWLTAARAAQGIGAAFLSPATLTIIVTTFSGLRLARALGLWAATGGAGGAAGVLIGGVLTSELGWRWVLFVNVPIGALTMIGAMAYLVEVRRPGSGARLDVWGSVTVTAGLAALAYAIVDTDEYSWGSTRTLVTLAVAFALLGVFLVLQAKVASSPLMPVRLFRSRWVTGANVVMLLAAAGIFSVWYFLSLFLQNVLQYDALRTGLAFAPLSATIVVGAQAAPRFLIRLGTRRVLLAGTLTAAAGFGWLTQIASSRGYWTVVFGGAVLVSLGIGMVYTALASAGTVGVESGDAGLASGVLNTSRQVGGSIGLAALATVASSHTAHLEHAGMQDTSAIAAGYGRAFAISCALMVAAFVAAFVVPAVTTTSSVDAAPISGMAGGRPSPADARPE